MGKVAISLKIMPESPEVDLEQVKKAISSKMQIQDSKIEPLAFGLKQLKVLIIMADKGGTEQAEKTIKSIKGVESVETESVTLV